MRFGFLAVFGLAIVFAGAAAGQRAQKTPAPPQTAAIDAAAVFRSPAWAEIALRKAELSAELESLLAEYTEEYPKIKEIRHTLETIDAERARLVKVKAADAERLTPALGRLIVRKTELEADYWRLLQSYKDEHPDVKRAKKKVDAFETSIREILGQ